MKKYEYECLEYVADKKSNELGRFLTDCFGKLGWQLINDYQTNTALGNQIRMLVFMREVETSDPNAMPTISKWLILTGSLMVIIAWLIGKIH